MEQTQGSTLGGSSFPDVFSKLVPEAAQANQATAAASTETQPGGEEPGKTPQTPGPEPVAPDQPEGTAPESPELTPIQYTKLSAELKAGEPLTEEQLDSLKAFEKNAVPSKVYTQQRQQDTVEVNQAKARIQELETQQVEFQKQAETLKNLQPYLRALQANPELVAQLEGTIKQVPGNMADPSVLAQFNPLIEAQSQRVAALEQSVSNFYVEQGRKEIQSFIDSKPELKDDPLMLERWKDNAQKLVTAGIGDFDLALKVSRAEAEAMRTPEVSPQKQAIKDLQKQAASTPTSKGAQPPATPQMTREQEIKQGMMRAMRGNIKDLEFKPL